MALCREVCSTSWLSETSVCGASSNKLEPPSHQTTNTFGFSGSGGGCSNTRVFKGKARAPGSSPPPAEVMYHINFWSCSIRHSAHEMCGLLGHEKTMPRTRTEHRATQATEGSTMSRCWKPSVSTSPRRNSAIRLTSLSASRPGQFTQYILALSNCNAQP